MKDSRVVMINPTLLKEEMNVVMTNRPVMETNRWRHKYRL